MDPAKSAHSIRQQPEGNAAGNTMSMSDIPILSMLRTRMQWHQERQHVLADNVANAETPNFRPRDLVELDFNAFAAAPPMLARTDPGHQAAPGGTPSFASSSSGSFAVKPAGNAVSLEEEMMKVASNQMDFQTVTTLYSKSLSLIKLAVGKK
jgi:flagellar basal-body rod protein FlgB